MKKFSVEGTSAATMEAAMANAMAKASQQGAGASSLNLSVASVTKDDEDIFHVIVTVSANDPGDENTPSDDDDDGDGTSGRTGRGRANLRMQRRAERISQELKDDLMLQWRQLHMGTSGPNNMADAYGQGLHQVIDSSPDVIVYDSMANDNKASSENSSFDVVTETPSMNSSVTADVPDDRISVNVLSREVDEVIGLLSLGFYEPPRPENGTPEEPEVVLTDNGDPRNPEEPDPREIPPPPAPDKEQPAPTA